MAAIVFSKPVPFPIGPMREALAKHLPLFRWRCGEGDRGEPHQVGDWADAPRITGQSELLALSVDTLAHPDAFPAPAPPHRWWLEVGRPTAGDAAVADRVVLLICETAMVLDEDAAHCQLSANGPWLTRAELLRAFKLVLAGEPLSLADGLGKPAAAFADIAAVPTPEPAYTQPAEGWPAFPRRAGGFGRKGL